MVMLDIFKSHDITIAHFNHGTRKSSDCDEKFVTEYAKNHHRAITLGGASLGVHVSEDTARTYRYNFLRGASVDNANAEIFTAHHLDDLIESVTINLLRGTGWRGLAVLDTNGIVRPFLEPETFGGTQPWSKKDILKYAAKHKISFRQDPTNNEAGYLRNRIRQQLVNLPATDKYTIYNLWQQQKTLKREIDQLVQELLPAVGMPWQRSWFQDLEPKVALELLRAGTLRAGISATRPQLENFRQAILTYAPGTFFNLPGDHLIKLSKTSFVL